MTPRPRDEHVRRRMEQQGRRDTAPELALRRVLHARGLRFRVDVAPVAGMRSRADVVFGPSKVAVFVDGCFWHMCPDHFISPANNADWWQTKLEGNRARDQRTDEFLRSNGWLPIRVWEHQDPTEAADVIERAVRARRPEQDRRSE